MTKLLSISSILLCLSFNIHAGSFVLQDYNVVTIENFETSSHVDGDVFVGGDLIANEKIGVGEHYDSAYIGASLKVAGYVDGNKGISVHGAMEVSDSNTITTTNGGTRYFVNDQEIQNTNGVSTNNDLLTDAINYKDELEQASVSLKNKSTNSTLTYLENKRTILQVEESLSTGDYAVFDLDSMNKFFTNTANQSIEILANNISDIAGVVINVSGTTIDQHNNASMLGTVLSDFREKILWNFYEATTISLSANNFMGTLLAPLATVTANGDIDGSVGAYSLITNREIHLHESVISPTVTAVKVNEPTTFILFAIALIAFIRRFAFK